MFETEIFTLIYTEVTKLFIVTKPMRERKRTKEQGKKVPRIKEPEKDWLKERENKRERRRKELRIR